MSNVSPPRRRLAALLVLVGPALAAGAEALEMAATAPGPPVALEHGKAGTADATPVDAGVLELEVAWAPVWIGAGGARGFDAGGEGNTHTFTLALSYGVARDVDVHLVGGLGTAYDGTADGTPGAPRYGHGMTDVAAGARWRFVRLPEGLDVAATGELVVPLGAGASDGQLAITQDYWSARAGLVISADLGRFTVNGEVAALVPFAGDAGALQGTVVANGAVGFVLSGWLQPELELNARNELGTAARVLALTGGVVAPFGTHRIIAAVQHGVVGHRAPEVTAALLAFKSSL